MNVNELVLMFELQKCPTDSPLYIESDYDRVIPVNSCGLSVNIDYAGCGDGEMVFYISSLTTDPEYATTCDGLASFIPANLDSFVDAMIYLYGEFFPITSVRFEQGKTIISAAWETP